MGNIFREYWPLGFYSMMIFLFTLTIGFIYEWKKGSTRMGLNFSNFKDKEKRYPKNLANS